MIKPDSGLVTCGLTRARRLQRVYPYRERVTEGNDKKNFSSGCVVLWMLDHAVGHRSVRTTLHPPA